LGGFAAFCGPMGFAFGAGRRGMGFRVFDRGDLKYVILKLLSKKPMHGYEVMRALEEESCGCYSASAGSVYPTLQMLEDQGYVVCEEKEGKKVYSITEEGRAFLEENGDLVSSAARCGIFPGRSASWLRLHLSEGSVGPSTRTSWSG
jgi:DNA-binding PadR family transcriptional regulator